MDTSPILPGSNSLEMAARWAELVTEHDRREAAFDATPTGSDEEREAHAKWIEICDELIDLPAPHMAAIVWKVGHFRGGVFQITDGDIEAIYEDLLVFAGLPLSEAVFDPAVWLTDFEANGGGWVVANAVPSFCVATGAADDSQARRLLRLLDDPMKRHMVVAAILERRPAVSEADHA